MAASGTGGVEAVYADENLWLSQKMKVFEDSELEEGSVIRILLIAAADGKPYDTNHYNLPAIIAVGYKVNSERAAQDFRFDDVLALLSLAP